MKIWGENLGHLPSYLWEPFYFFLTRSHESPTCWALMRTAQLLCIKVENTHSPSPTPTCTMKHFCYCQHCKPLSKVPHQRQQNFNGYWELFFVLFVSLIKLLTWHLFATYNLQLLKLHQFVQHNFLPLICKLGLWRSFFLTFCLNMIACRLQKVIAILKESRPAPRW